MTALSAAAFAARRQQLAQHMGTNAIAIIATRDELYRNRDADYKYRADSSFYYLTGFGEPEAVAVLETDNNGKLCYTLFCRERNRDLEIWTGKRAGLDGAKSLYGADQAFVISDLDTHMPRLLNHKNTLFARFGHSTEFDHKLSTWFGQLHRQQRSGSHTPLQMRSLDMIIDEMRLLKSADEIALMQTAADISADAHNRAMQMVRPGMMEYALEAEILYDFARHGCVPAYNSIVGGGENGCILHYVDNNQALKAGDLVLIDAGCEYHHYAADITRTFPINGKFSGEQRALYEVVLNAQIAAIAATQTKNHYKYPHQVAVKILTEGLLDLGLLHGELNELIETEAYKPFYMHGTGHWLGMDVHDVGDYKSCDSLNPDQWRQYQPGMVVTVEPGLYIAPDQAHVDARWRGIGIRIEDDVLVTDDVPQVLTSHAIKTIDDIEYAMRHNAKTV